MVVEGGVSVAGVGPRAKKKGGLYFFVDDAQVLEWRTIYYRDERVLFLMLPYLRGRETALISGGGGFAPARHMKIHSLAFLKSNFDAFDFMNRDYMVYYSLASYMNHPVFSYNPVERQRQQREWTDGVRDESGVLVEGAQMGKYIVGYDLAFDMDNHGRVYRDVRRSLAYRDCRVLRDYLRRFGVKYRIVFSGSGFHLVVPFEEFASAAGGVGVLDFMKEGNPYNFCMRVRRRLRDMLGLASVDLTIVDAARVFKAPWSFSKYGTVAVPMANDVQFDNFDVNSCDPRRVLARTDLFMRGLEWTNSGVAGGFLRMLKVLRKW